MKLTPAREKFILHWGEMGTKWGINRTVAQIHALLHVTGKAADAERRLPRRWGWRGQMFSNSLKEWQGWGIVRVVHVMGDRRDHFESEKDVWTLFQIIMDERKKRELDPTLVVLKECVAEAKKEGDEAGQARGSGSWRNLWSRCAGGTGSCGSCRCRAGGRWRRWAGRWGSCWADRRASFFVTNFLLLQK